MMALLHLMPQHEQSLFNGKSGATYIDPTLAALPSVLRSGYDDTSSQ